MRFSSLRALFERHADLCMPVPLTCAAGKASLSGGVLRVAGRTTAAMVRLDNAPAQTVATDGRFAISVAVQGDPAQVVLWLGDQAEVLTLPNAGTVARARYRHVPRFARDLLRASPLLVRWMWLRRPPDLIPAIRARLSMAHVARAGLLDAGRLDQPPQPAPMPRLPVQIVIPVFNAFSVLTEAIDRVTRHTDLPYHLIVIDDASTDPAVRPYLTARLAGLPATLLVNERNLGFICSVNRGLKQAMVAGGHVVLLNSDALVPAGWIQRLLSPMLLQPDTVASVTPMSNAAQILSVPLIGPGQQIAPGQADALDVAAQGMKALPQDIPTGIGFCMAMNAGFLARLGGFDPVFGRGYGEEVDWCLRAVAVGGRHLAQPGLFVEHRAAQSFGTVERRRATLAAADLLRQRYPRYDADVQRFAANDPLLTERLALGFAMLAAKGPVPVHIGHSLGGGAEADLKRRLAGGGAVVLRVGGRVRWRLELHLAAGMVAGETADFALIRRLLGLLPDKRMIYGCGVGDADPVALPALLLSLLRPSDGLELLIHDYFAVSPSFTLLPQSGHYDGVPPDGCTDPAHIARDTAGLPVPLAQWRREWERLVARAGAVTCFSNASARIITEVWPKAPVRIAPHPMPPGLRVVARQGPPVLGVLGNIRLHKGARQVAALAELRPDLPMVIIGHFEPGQPLPPGVRLHGQYRPCDLPALISRYGITHWLIPSVWPETFCFAVHEALATGLPVLGFDLGAQGEALIAAANGQAVPLAAGPAALAALL